MNAEDFEDADYVDLLTSDLLVPHYLIHCAIYYRYDTNVISDRQFDLLAQQLDRHWDEVEHPHKHLIDRTALSSGGSYLIYTLPLRVTNCAKQIIRELAL